MRNLCPDRIANKDERLVVVNDLYPRVSQQFGLSGGDLCFQKPGEAEWRGSFKGSESNTVGTGGRFRDRLLVFNIPVDTEISRERRGGFHHLNLH